MSSTWGERVKISIFGESHGEGLGVVIDGLPAGEAVDMQEVLLQMGRRAPGQDKTATPRKESDTPEILSGMLHDTTTGAPLCAVIRNHNTRSGDYGNLVARPRPGHSDYTAAVRYQGHNDIRGGGHFSGRLTAGIVFAGAVCRQILARRGVEIGAHIYAIAGVHDAPFDKAAVPKELLLRLSRSRFALIDPKQEAPMRAAVEEARMSLDSVGGIVECAVIGLPAGLGSPMFGGVENVLSSLLFGIPAVKGVEFGAGFGACSMRGSRHNDPFYYDENGVVRTRTNHAGGILGGITTGMPLIVRAAVKPTASISQPQHTVDLETGKDTILEVRGRHDPCIVPRAVPVVEAAAALGVLNLMMEGNQL